MCHKIPAPLFTQEICNRWSSAECGQSISEPTNEIHAEEPVEGLESGHTE